MADPDDSEAGPDQARFDEEEYRANVTRFLTAKISDDFSTIWSEWKKGAKDGWAILLGLATWAGLLTLAGHEPSSWSVGRQLRAATSWADHLSAKIGISRTIVAVIITTILGVLLAVRGAQIEAKSIFDVWGRGTRNLFSMPSYLLFLSASVLITHSLPFQNWKLSLALTPAMLAFSFYPRVAVSVWSALLILVGISAASALLW
jgi:ABC-type dipeptide/oligopeptide/nickel transport system permease subunit